MTGQLPCDASRAFSGRQVVDRADIIQATAGHEVSTGRICTGHDPAGAQRDRMNLVGSVGIPDDELAVLRSRDKVSSVGGPMHSIDFGEMALEVTSWLHAYAW